MGVRVGNAAIFEGSNGDHYTGWQVNRRIRNGTWKLCIGDEASDRFLVETTDDTLLMLTRTETEALPDWRVIRTDRSGARVVDVRRTRP